VSHSQESRGDPGDDFDYRDSHWDEREEAGSEGASQRDDQNDYDFGEHDTDDDVNVGKDNDDGEDGVDGEHSSNDEMGASVVPPVARISSPAEDGGEATEVIDVDDDSDDLQVSDGCGGVGLSDAASEDEEASPAACESDQEHRDDPGPAMGGGCSSLSFASVRRGALRTITPPSRGNAAVSPQSQDVVEAASKGGSGEAKRAKPWQGPGGKWRYKKKSQKGEQGKDASTSQASGSKSSKSSRSNSFSQPTAKVAKKAKTKSSMQKIGASTLKQQQLNFGGGPPA
jgi:hypothetical protein